MTSISAQRALAPAIVIWSRGLLVAFAVLLAFVVLWPTSDHAGGGIVAALSRFIAGFGLFPYNLTFEVLEFVANVALFVPLGVLLPLALGSVRPLTLWFTVAAGLVTSTCIEFAQLFISGRVSDPRDLVSNTLGTLFGVLLVYLLKVRLSILLYRETFSEHTKCG